MVFESPCAKYINEMVEMGGKKRPRRPTWRVRHLPDRYTAEYRMVQLQQYTLPAVVVILSSSNCHCG